LDSLVKGYKKKITVTIVYITRPFITISLYKNLDDRFLQCLRQTRAVYTSHENVELNVWYKLYCVLRKLSTLYDQ